MDVITRRRAIALLTAALAQHPLAAWAQSANRPVIGFLRAGKPPKELADAFESGLRDEGFVAGQNVTIAFGIGDTGQLPRLAAAMVKSNVDVILASASSAAVAAKEATSTIPIVMAAVYHPVEVGIVASLARPGGNVTGTAVTVGDMAGKRLQLLRELVPALKRVAMLSHAGHASNAVQVEAVEGAARLLGLQLHTVAVSRESEFEPALSAMQGIDGLLHADTPLFNSNRDLLLKAIAKKQIPAIHPVRGYPDEGGLISYGADVPDLFRRSGHYVAKILKGARPADLPVEQPTKFELVINRQTAKAFGLSLPASLLVRADDVVE